MTVGVLVLAAGRARRFGADKRLAHLPDGRRVLMATLENIGASGLPMVVCVDARDDELIDFLESQGIDCRRCRRAGEGMGATLAEGIASARHWRGVLVALADIPWIAPQTYATVAERLRDHSIAVPVYDGRRGHPVGFGRAFYPALSTLSGDTGARRIVQAYACDVQLLEVCDEAIHWDIDHPADLTSR